MRAPRFLLAAFLVSSVGHAAADFARPRNIVIIYADDLGYGDLSCYGAHRVSTPHVDRLAREGLRFTSAHTTSATCTPSRFALLSGEYPWRRDGTGVLPGDAALVIATQRATLPAILQRAGYATAAIGKWHLGLDWVRTGPLLENVDFSKPFAAGPTTHGFDRFFGISASLDMPPYVWLAQDRATLVPTATVADSPTPKLWRAGPIAADFKMEDVQPRLIATALDYIAERAAAKDGKPFFLYLPLAAPHTPVLPTRDFEGKTKTTSYGDFVAQVDADVGQLVMTLEKHGLSKNTLVIFTSDNGFAPAADVPGHGIKHAATAVHGADA
jgi:arylsulfatase A-like enzyme